MEKSSRPKRQRRHSRRAWPPEEDDVHHLRPAKRLFTLDIKRMLKDWLIRRRDNPYPSRDEKKRLAIETGLTYTQICNWFANWRRKLKNSENRRGDSQKSWGHLIKNYNSNARGNVEQFSISSEDSIWGEHNDRYMDYKLNNDDDEESHETMTRSMDTYYSRSYDQQMHYASMLANQQSYDDFKDCTYNSTDAVNTYNYSNGNDCNNNNNNNNSNCKTKYKQKIMEKYMREEQAGTQEHMIEDASTTKELSKWLESAVNFTPNKNNYYIEWNNKKHKFENGNPAIPYRHVVDASCSPSNQIDNNSSNMENDIIHHKDELDAAEALTNMAFNCRQRMLDAATVHMPTTNSNHVNSSFQRAVQILPF